MTLKDYFRTHPDTTKRDLAKLLDVDVATLFSWTAGRTPSLRYAIAIEEATDGKVTPKDLIGGNIEEERKEKKRRKK